ncbi:MAG: hypothetical protein IT537_24615 [Hyphomicrobiales bacterium]|nr:hypothetical protein [Hyphomicrobiales bacterium]
MQVAKLPYEVLFRFDEFGALAGAHVQWRHVITDDAGSKVAEAIEHAKPVAIGEREGFPLTDILDEVQRAAVLQAESVTARLEKMGEEHAGAVAELAALKSQIVAAQPASQ